ncbi:response regulator [Opitutus terrae]|uniref:Sensory/regulatory protein RpfC n=1 Tax=Opitutus terrae (strain DSM 11246 / JCM 15787 / PB90-1) TaxID=452637 RepID=B1ZZ41_OPITP|nr:response regulator [Opitutus terrae]ACB77113.1 histidine kinase [Opitutus terrae PB90-1]
MGAAVLAAARQARAAEAAGLSGADGGAVGWAIVGLLVVLAALAVTIWALWKARQASESERRHQRTAGAAEHAAAAAAAQAREAAASAARVKTEFLATMSHEIRTPLNGVLGTVDLLLGTPLTPAQGDYLATIRTSAEALRAVTDDLLDFSKLEQGSLMLEHARFDLRQPVVDALTIASTRLASPDVELVLDLAADVPASVYGDAMRLRQVLVKLLSNAVKFTAHGHVAVRVSRATSESEGQRARVRFTVSDTGVGIASEMRDRLFQQFTQADTSATRRHGGTGLGLAISQRLVRLLGGEIEWESAPGRGSVFWFTVPLQVDQSAAPPPPMPAVRVLVIDDLTVAAQALQNLLATMQLSAETATTPADAAALLRAGLEAGAPFDVVLVDRSVAAQGEWMQPLRTAPEFTPLRWVLLENAQVAGPAQPLPAGFAARIMKPVLQPDQIVEALREARQTAEPARTTEPEPVHLSRPGLRLLVAEDNGVNRVVAAGMLKKLGCVVDFAENGAEAVRKCRLNRYDMVLMDCLMPEMDGWTATREIRRWDSRIPIVAVTANATNEDRSRCLQAGMTDYLPKPLRLPELARVMERWVG